MSQGSTHRRKGRVERLTKRQKVAAGLGALVLLAAMGGAAAVLSNGPSQAAAKPLRHSHKAQPAQPAKNVVKSPSHLCPLTGTPAPGGKVPARPALGIKIGNDPASRPQTGLEHADIVYEEMAEGGITRYLAVFQCHQAPVLGPVRSVRWTDWHVLASYGHPILAFSGGISYWDNLVARLGWLYDANGSFPPGEYAYYRTSNRVAPWNLYTSTARIWALDRAKTPPPPQFRYSDSLQAGFTKASAVTVVGFAEGVNVVWRWSTAVGAWQRYYANTPDTDSTGVQLQAKNVVIEMVQTHSGPYAESGSTFGTDSITKGSGVAYVFRDGHFEKGSWRRPNYHDPMGLYFANGKRVDLTPGNTWVEMVPTTYAVQVSR